MGGHQVAAPGRVRLAGGWASKLDTAEGKSIEYSMDQASPSTQIETHGSARAAEAALLERCLHAAREDAQSAQDQREANVFCLAAMVIQSDFPAESMSLKWAGERYFDAHPTDRVELADIVRRGWVTSLPRLRVLLGQQLRRP